MCVMFIAYLVSPVKGIEYTCSNNSPSAVVSLFDHKDPTSILLDLWAQTQGVCRQQINVPYFTELKICKAYELEFLRYQQNSQICMFNSWPMAITKEYFPVELEPSVLESFCRTLQNLKTLGVPWFLSHYHTPHMCWVNIMFWQVLKLAVTWHDTMAFITVNINCALCFNWSQAWMN